MGTIYKRGKTYWIKYQQNGKAFYETTRSTKWAAVNICNNFAWFNLEENVDSSMETISTMTLF